MRAGFDNTESMQTTKTVFVMSTRCGGTVLVAVLCLNHLSFGASRRTAIMLLCRVHTDHSPGSLEGQKHQQKDEYKLFHSSWIISNLAGNSHGRRPIPHSDADADADALRL